MGTADDAIKTAPASQLRLLRRGLPQVVHHLRASTPEEERAARQAASAARERLAHHMMRIDDQVGEAIAAAQAECDAADAALATCYEPVIIQALPPAVFETLVAEFPAREGKDEAWNIETLPPALFLASVRGELTAEQWEKEVLPQLAHGEVQGLRNSALAVNARFVGGDVPKG
jgi:hypothetical protein